MAIFVDESNNEPINGIRSKREWVDLIKEYLSEKSKGVTAQSFAKNNDIDVNQFRSAYGKYDRIAKRELKAQPLTEAKSNKGKSSKKKERKRDLIKSFRSQLKKTASQSAAANNNKSLKWFKGVIDDAVRGRKVSRPEVGKIYTYAYDAKYKNELPYWDRYPLIIYLGNYKAKNGNTNMLGLNLHYIPPRARQAFLEELLPRANTDTISNKTKLKINWSMVKGMRGSDQMIKAYIPKRIRSGIKEVKPSDWINIIFLPIQQFVSKGKRYSANKVWRNVR